MDKVKNIIQASIDTKQAILQQPSLLQKINTVVDVITNAFANKNHVYFCGNGGSAADAQHLAAEFSGRFYKNRKALPAEALHCNTSYLTAVANDFGYEEVFARMIEGTGNEGDVLIGISTSGNSPNIVKALAVAKTKKIHTISFTGTGGGELKSLSDFCLEIPSDDTPRIQESHILIGHIICQLVEEKLFASTDNA